MSRKQSYFILWFTPCLTSIVGPMIPTPSVLHIVSKWQEHSASQHFLCLLSIIRRNVGERTHIIGTSEYYDRKILSDLDLYSIAPFGCKLTFPSTFDESSLFLPFFRKYFSSTKWTWHASGTYFICSVWDKIDSVLCSRPSQITATWESYLPNPLIPASPPLTVVDGRCRSMSNC